MSEKSTIPKPQYTLWDGFTVCLAICQRALAEVRALARLPGPPGETGPEGKRGLAGERGEKGDRGEPGRPGAMGAAGVDGKDGRAGKDGRDGLSPEEYKQLDEPLRYGLRVVRGDQVTDYWWTKPTLADYDHGIWKEGTTYARGAMVTYGGSAFLAHVETAAKPETSQDWRLFVKRGRDGKDGKEGKPGPIGMKGEKGDAGPRAYGG